MNNRFKDIGSIFLFTWKLVSENIFLRQFLINKIQARSSSGLGRCPLKAETTGSNPVRATDSNCKIQISNPRLSLVER